MRKMRLFFRRMAAWLSNPDELRLLESLEGIANLCKMAPGTPAEFLMRATSLRLERLRTVCKEAGIPAWKIWAFGG